MQPIKYKKNYNFSYADNFCNICARNFSNAFQSFAAQPNLRYLEIGVNEGSSLIWMLENILTQPTSQAIGIDWFAGQKKQTITKPQLLKNIALSECTSQVTILEGPSEVELRKIEPHSIDLLYIDGGHDLKSTFLDLGIAWTLLKHKGVLIIDDFGGKSFDGYPTSLRNKEIVSIFLFGFRNDVDVIFKNRQVGLIKKARLDEVASQTTSIHYLNYSFCWYAGTLRKNQILCANISEDQINQLRHSFKKYDRELFLNGEPNSGTLAELEKLLSKST